MSNKVWHSESFPGLWGQIKQTYSSMQKISSIQKYLCYMDQLSKGGKKFQENEDILKGTIPGHFM